MANSVQVYLLICALVVLVSLLPISEAHFNNINIQELGKKLKELISGASSAVESLGNAAKESGGMIEKLGSGQLDIFKSIKDMFKIFGRTKASNDEVEIVDSP